MTIHNSAPSLTLTPWILARELILRVFLSSCCYCLWSIWNVRKRNLMSLDLFTKHNHPWIFGTSVFCLKKVNSSGVPRLWVLFTKTLQYQHIQHAKPSWNSSNAMLDDWKPPKMSCFNLWLVSATTFQASPSCRHPPTPEGRNVLLPLFLFGLLADSSRFPSSLSFHHE